MEKMTVTRGHGFTGSTAILRVTGPLTLATAFVLQDELGAIGDVDTVIDVSASPYMDSAGLGAILSHWTHTQRSGRKFALTGVTPRVALLLEITKADMVLPIFATAEEADRAFAPKAATA
jgi:anti-anti-sigma factor